MLETVRFTAKYIHWANTTLLDHLDNQPLHRNHNHNHLDTLITAALAALHRTLAAHLASPVAELPELVSPSQSIRDLSAALIAHYETTPKEPLNAEIGLAVLHLLNTTTTLRGTISAYLSMLGRKPLAFDILYVRADTPLTDLTFPRIHANLNMQAYDTLQTLQLLSDADYRANSGLCFRSIHGTLNHIYMSDLIWYERLHGIDPSRFDPYWVRPDEEMYASTDSEGIDWEEYISDRAKLDSLTREQQRKWIEYMESVEEAENAYEKGVGRIWLHVINHAFHHRGQIEAVLNRMVLSDGLLGESKQ